MQAVGLNLRRGVGSERQPPARSELEHDQARVPSAPTSTSTAPSSGALSGLAPDRSQSSHRAVPHTRTKTDTPMTMAATTSMPPMASCGTFTAADSAAPPVWSTSSRGRSSIASRHASWQPEATPATREVLRPARATSPLVSRKVVQTWRASSAPRRRSVSASASGTRCQPAGTSLSRGAATSSRYSRAGGAYLMTICCSDKPSSEGPRLRTYRPSRARYSGTPCRAVEFPCAMGSGVAQMVLPPSTPTTAPHAAGVPQTCVAAAASNRPRRPAARARMTAPLAMTPGRFPAAAGPRRGCAS
mmetsp:Transcript_86601/g.223054  ORF Transcript_86601/g.223054 Transcript_86601/m.223054 type:complete len:302 (+) Transcript_86601:65-970(+)